MDTQAGYESSLRFRERRFYRWKVSNIFSRSLPTEYSEPLLQSSTDGQRITTITILLRLRAHSQIPDRRRLFGARSTGKDLGPPASENTRSCLWELRSSSRIKCQ